MPTLTVRNLPSPLYKALRQRAKENHRSLNGEVLAILERIYAAPRMEPAAFIRDLRAWRRRLKIPPLAKDLPPEAIEEGRP